MCNPPAIIAGATLAINAGSALARQSAQNKQSAQTREAALQDLKSTTGQLAIRQVQQREAAGQTLMQIDRSAQRAQAQEVVSAGARNVSGASVHAILDTIEGQAATNESTVQRNLTMQQEQINAAIRSADTRAMRQIASSPPANPFMTVLQIGEAGLQFAGSVIQSKPPGEKAPPKNPKS